MKFVLKLEELGLVILFSFIYFHFYQGGWPLFLGLFFVPDISFILFLVSRKVGAAGYNILHHKGFMVMVMFVGYLLNNAIVIQTGLIFMAHSCFDRFVGYGLKYFDSFEHTHLGWVGKSKQLNL
jgi:hypothetical protein